MTEQEYHQWELEQQEQEEQGQMLNDSLYDEEKERRAGITQAIQSYWKNRRSEIK
tara:strand:- start:1823 stop:1987 length:165 start_codon:yes stop_codon:yes gene_type:complete